VWARLSRDSQTVLVKQGGLLTAIRLSIPAAELGRRIGERLRGSAATGIAKYVWQGDGQRVLIHGDSLVVRFLESWLVLNLDLQTDQTGRQTLQFVFFLGKPGDGDGIQAACTINAPTVGGGQLAAAWGADLQRVLWDAVLDTMEAAVYHAANQKLGAVTLQGFHCTPDVMNIDMIAGEF
jgi:hypothetical protein